MKSLKSSSGKKRLIFFQIFEKKKNFKKKKKKQVGSTQSVIIVLDNWEAKVVGWGPTPVYRAPPVGYTFSWGFYE